MSRTFEDHPVSLKLAQVPTAVLSEPHIRHPGDHQGHPLAGVDAGAMGDNQREEGGSMRFAASSATNASTTAASVNYLQTAAPQVNAFKDLQTALRQMDSNFIFPVGTAEAGKTVALYSMLRYLMTTDSPGQLYPFDSTWKAVDQTGKILNEVSTMFRESKLPAATHVNYENEFTFTKQANYEFEPNDKKFPPLRLTFVDLGGDNFESFAKTEHFPPGIDVFFQVGGLSLTFLLMTSPDRAEKDDQLFSLFLGHIAKQDPVFRTARAAIIITKWDTYSGYDSPSEYIEKWMPMTYKATRNPSNALMCFTVGTVRKDADGQTEWIKEFNPAPAAALFKWVYKSITNVNLDAKPWWQRFLKGI